ncbi:hypothetical protein SAMN06264364_12096 [Quadrisphaera granulorum]|uniref:RelA/SpoT family protein n=2 Tax=Quadrisphaera granulorum TaxID=317664 RepID=A0A316AP06_9ACTN|nr:RelA/SpoT family protein [Quadrisphaera granulorum]SZE97764.1 hypothetical protein SAMN06264364_12096 [Quadrisphaera granulorum]
MNLNEALERYTAERPRFQRAAEQVRVRLEHLAAENGLSCRVSAREKDPQGYMIKVVTKGYADAWGEVTDKAGARVIFDRPSHVDDFTKIIDEDPELAVIRIEDKREITDPERLAYSGVHIQVAVTADDGASEAIECEVQLRTAAQDIWSILSHKLLYKPIVELPREQQHAIYRLVALIELFDMEVERVMDALPQQPGYEYSEVLREVESDFLRLTESLSFRRLSIYILDSLQGVIPSDDSYVTKVREYVAANEESLRSIYSDYGPHSDMSSSPDYALFGQAESLMLLERLDNDAFALLSAWNAAGLPEEWLRTLASVSDADIAF